MILCYETWIYRPRVCKQTPRHKKQFDIYGPDFYVVFATFFLPAGCCLFRRIKALGNTAKKKKRALEGSSRTWSRREGLKEFVLKLFSLLREFVRWDYLRLFDGLTKLIQILRNRIKKSSHWTILSNEHFLFVPQTFKHFYYLFVASWQGAVIGMLLANILYSLTHYHNWIIHQQEAHV